MFATGLLVFLAAPAAEAAKQGKITFYTDSACKKAQTSTANTASKAGHGAAQALLTTPFGLSQAWADYISDSTATDYFKKNGVYKTGCVEAKASQSVVKMHGGAANALSFDFGCEDGKQTMTRHAKAKCADTTPAANDKLTMTMADCSGPTTPKFTCTKPSSSSSSRTTTMMIPVLASSLLFVFINAV